MEGRCRALSNVLDLISTLTQILNPVNLNKLQDVFAITVTPPEEATEVMEDPEGRWVPFNVKGTHLFILEKKGLPQHVRSMENVDKAVTLQSLVMDLQDQGEAS